MSMMRIQPAPFFASKNRAFWNLQLAGWGGAFLLRAVNALANGLPLNLLALIVVMSSTPSPQAACARRGLSRESSAIT